MAAIPFTPEDQAASARLDRREMQYVYPDGDGFVFLDVETCEQANLPADAAGPLMRFLREGSRVQVVFHEGRPLSVELPGRVELTVTDVEPGPRGATDEARYQTVLLETGLKVAVPPGIAVGETIAVDTRTGAYLSRASR